MLVIKQVGEHSFEILTGKGKQAAHASQLKMCVEVDEGEERWELVGNGVRKAVMGASKRTRPGSDEGFAKIPRAEVAEALDLLAVVSSAAATADPPALPPEDLAAGPGPRQPAKRRPEHLFSPSV